MIGLALGALGITLAGLAYSSKGEKAFGFWLLVMFCILALANLNH